MLDLRPEHLKHYEQLAKGRSAQPPAKPVTANDSGTPVTSGQTGTGRLNPPCLPAKGTPSAGAAASAGLRQASDLMELLGYDDLTRHRDEIKIYYLIGCCYQQGARSARNIVEMLAALPPGLAADDLAGRVIRTLDWKPRQPKAITVPLNNLAKLLSEHLDTDVHLVSCVGDGFAFDGLTETGELFWRLVADYLRKYLK